MVEINRLTANKAHPFTAVKQDISADNNLVNQLTALQKNIIQLVNSVIENEQKKTASQNQSDTNIPILTPPTDNSLSSVDNNAKLLLLMKQYQHLIGKNEIKNLRENLTQWKIQAQLNHQIQQAKKVEQIYLEVEKKLNQHRDDFIDSWLRVANGLHEQTEDGANALANLFANQGLSGRLRQAIAGKNRLTDRQQMSKLLEEEFPWLKLDLTNAKLSVDELNQKKLAIKQFCRGIEHNRLKPIFSDSTSQTDKEWRDDNGIIHTEWYNAVRYSMDYDERTLRSISYAQGAYKSLVRDTEDQRERLANLKNDTDIAEQLNEAEKSIFSLKLATFKTLIELESQHLQGSAKLTYLMAKMRELLGSLTLESMSSQREILQEMQRMTEIQAEKRAQDIDEKIRNAEEARKWMAIGSQIFSWLIAAVGVVAAAFTGGASLALAAVGIALLAADTICQAAGGGSFMNKALAPVGEAMMKMAESISDFLCQIAVSEAKLNGASESEIAELKKQAKEITDIVATIIVAVTMVAAAIGTAKLASVAGKMIGKIIADKLKRALNQLLDKMINNLLSNLARIVGNDTSKMIAIAIKQAFNNLLDKTINNTLISSMKNKLAPYINASMVQKSLIGLSVVNANTSAGLNLHAANLEADVIKRLGDLTVINQIMAQLDKLLNQVMDNFAQEMETVAELMRKIGEMGSQSLHTGKYITHNLNTMA
ncbi:type III secretion system translocon subunit SctE [Arsenophonus nasoniae]|uniref:Type III secretion system translocon subunit SctE n=1 Tax=Arsenophonus nasoniae TaxID=638 RepID=A0AA95GA40_9GAMM|nr:type III secretion system translocon subunit SctE [Arsenophonus nasoniae]WGL95121.1 type III secretion system translocon subunit SctE [Arsenophonus nasoniae]